MQKINVLCKAVKGFNGDMEIKATGFIDYTKGSYTGELAKNYGAGRVFPSKKFPVPYARAQKIAVKRGKFDAFREKGELELLCDCEYYKGTEKETGVVKHWVRINLGTTEKPYERNFFINEDVLETMDDLHIKQEFIDTDLEADVQDEQDVIQDAQFNE